MQTALRLAVTWVFSLCFTAAVPKKSKTLVVFNLGGSVFFFWGVVALVLFEGAFLKASSMGPDL